MCWNFTIRWSIGHKRRINMVRMLGEFTKLLGLVLASTFVFSTAVELYGHIQLETFSTVITKLTFVVHFLVLLGITLTLATEVFSDGMMSRRTHFFLTLCTGIVVLNGFARVWVLRHFESPLSAELFTGPLFRIAIVYILIMVTMNIKRTLTLLAED